MSAANPTQVLNSRRATAWQLRTRVLPLERRPLIMGIVNVTPDSFSDGGRHGSTEAAVAHALSLAADGADLLDIGGESTRPYARVVSTEEELDRVAPVVEAVSRAVNTPISIDTSKAAVAETAISLGAEVINDVTGLAGDPAMIPLAVRTGVGVCAMHMQGTPQTMQDDPRYEDVVEEIYQYLAARRDALLAAGVEPARVCLDPGIGFGKTHQHNLTLMAGCGRFVELGRPVLIGHSRKGFLAKLLPAGQADDQAARDAATAGAALAVAAQGIHVLRVHNVRLVRDALLGFAGCGGIDGSAATLPTHSP